MLTNLIAATAQGKDVYLPMFFRLQNEADKKNLDELLSSEKNIEVYDEITGQLQELVKGRNPTIKLKDTDYPPLVEAHLNGADRLDYGVWVYYPWSRRLVHILDEAEFAEVRTNRNQYKITPEEQAQLGQKKIGILGLSVGQSIALTLTMERAYGELRLADFDILELSNMNRIRAGAHSLGISKVVVAAREITEIDPFMKVTLFKDGLTEDNIAEFFTANGKLDVLIEVCDGLDIKILSRYKARELQIPVVMDTSDRGMIDIERFDLEPARPILHGLVGDIDPQKVKGLTNEQKIPYILPMISAQDISSRLKASMMEVEQSITTWPQLASSVVLGGAIGADVCRRILLDQYHQSGRYYIDVEDQIKDPEPKKQQYHPVEPAALTPDDLQHIAKRFNAGQPGAALSEDDLNAIVTAGTQAPSGGNAQPWKFLYKNDRLFIFHDVHFSFSLLDYKNYGSYLAFGAMLQNISLRSAALGYALHETLFPLTDDQRLVAVLSFEKKKEEQPYLHLEPTIGTRVTNRVTAERKLLPASEKEALQQAAAYTKGAKLHLFEREEDLVEFADIFSSVEKIRFLHPWGHYDTFFKELRFTPEEIQSTRDGLDIATLEITNSEQAAMQIAKDTNAIAFLNSEQKGKAFKKITTKVVTHASAIGVLTMDGHKEIDFLNGGRAVERVWMEANHRGISFQPVSQLVFLSERFNDTGGSDFNKHEQNELRELITRFKNTTQFEEGRHPVFIFRFCYADAPRVRSLRKTLEEVLFS